MDGFRCAFVPAAVDGVFPVISASLAINHGSGVMAVEVTLHPASPQKVATQVDLSILTDEELETLARLSERAHRCPD
jgi:hypothetical protein